MECHVSEFFFGLTTCEAMELFTLGLVAVTVALSSILYVSQFFFGLTTCAAMQWLDFGLAAMTVGSIGGLLCVVMFSRLRIREAGQYSQFVCA